MADLMANYLNTIGKFDSLDFAREQELAMRVKNGDMVAFRLLMNSYLKLVVRVATSFRGYGLPLEELVQEGNIGLMQAIRRFEAERGLRLSTYAMFWIRAQMQEYILNNWSLVKIGTSSIQKKLFFNLRRMKAEILADNVTHLSPEAIAKIAKELGVNTADVITMDQRLRHGDESLNTPVGHEDGDREWMEFIPETRPNPEMLMGRKQEALRRRAMLDGALRVLDERERHIFVARHLQDSEDTPTLETLSSTFGVSRERVRQLEARAMKKVSTHLKSANS